MNPFLQVIPFALMLSLYACYLKVSARMLGRFSITWKHSFIYVATVGALVILIRLLSLCMAGTFQGLFVSLSVIALQLLFGAWFLGSRVTSAEDRPLGWARAAGVVAIAMGFMCATGILLWGIATVMESQMRS